MGIASGRKMSEVHDSNKESEENNDEDLVILNAVSRGTYDIGIIDFTILDAISRGIDAIDKIARMTELDEAEVELAINRLGTHRLIFASSKKRALLERRGLQISMTETGSRLLEEKKRFLEKKATDLRGSYYAGNSQATQLLIEENRAWLPIMILSGLLNAVMFESIMSFARMPMNSVEAAIAANAYAAAGSQDTSVDSGANESLFENTNDGADFGIIGHTSDDNSADRKDITNTKVDAA